MKTQTSSINAAEVALQTERILASRIFEKARRSQRLLRYLVDAALADPPRAVKEYTLAVDVFDRDASYDPAIDATVRVEAGRLRTRLREYYGEEGRQDALLVELPKGAYSVSLTLRCDREVEAVDRVESGAAQKVAQKARHTAEPGPWFSHTSKAITWTTENRAADVDDEANRLSAHSMALPQVGLPGLPVGDRRIGRYTLPLLAIAIILGYAGWRLVEARRPASNLPTVAVLPLKNLSGDPTQDYFADGTTDELITELARVPGLRVVSWNSAVQEKDTKKSLQTIARELRADLLVEGSISRIGNTVRINAQLIDTRKDNHLWANSFEGPLSEVMALENRAAAEIVDQARAGGRGVQSSGPAWTAEVVDPAAHDAYLRGRNYFDKRQGSESVAQFQRAIELSPGYASAYAGLAVALQTEALLGETRPEQIVPTAMAAVNKALELDPGNGDALIARGAIETTFLWNWKDAEHDLTRGIALSPNNTYGRMMLSVYLDSVGRREDAVEQMRQAVEIDPLSFYMARHLGTTLYYARHYDEALRQLQYAREMHPASAIVVDHWITDVYEKKGMYDDAVRYDLLGLQKTRFTQDQKKLLAAYHQNGWQGYWAARLHEVRGESSDPLYNWEAGIAAMRAGHHKEAIVFLKRAADEHCYWMATASIDPLLDDLRQYPAFSEVLATVHLPPSGRR